MCDFAILSLPGAGSHMLASALDSHPQISCSGETGLNYSWLGTAGEISGHIIRPHQTEQVPVTTKLIVLLRDPKGAMLSRAARVGRYHYLEPITISNPDVSYAESYLQHYREMDEEIKDIAQQYPHIVISYESITGNDDIREIPERQAKCICAFLGVRYQPLKPKTHKPKLCAA